MRDFLLKFARALLTVNHLIILHAKIGISSIVQYDHRKHAIAKSDPRKYARSTGRCGFIWIKGYLRCKKFVYGQIDPAAIFDLAAVVNF